MKVADAGAPAVPLPGGRELTDLSTEITSRQRSDTLSRLLDGIWRVMASPRLTLVLLLWLGCVVAFSLLIPQTAYQLEDPLQRSRWLAGVPREMWPVMEGLQPWGLFQLLSSVWLRLPLALLLAHSAVMLTACAPAAWQRTFGCVTSPTDPLTLSRLGRQHIAALETTRPDVDVTDRLRRVGYRIEVHDDEAAWVGRRQAHGWLAYTGLYAGLTLVAAGLLLQGWLGQALEMDLQPGQATRLPGEGQTTLILDAVSTPAEQGHTDAVGGVTLRIIREVGDEDRFEMPLHHSQLVQGVWLTAVNTAPIVELSATDISTGDEVLLQPLMAPGPPQGRVRLPLTTSAEERFVGIPAHNLTLRVDYATPETATVGQFVVRFFRGADTSPELVTELGDGTSVEYGGVRYRLDLAHTVRLRLHGGVGWMSAGVGWLIVMVCTMLLATVSPGWLVVRPRGLQMTVVTDTLAGEHAEQRDRRGLNTLVGEDRP